MNPRRLYRSRSDRAIAGIAGGMAEYLEVDPTVVRILWILAGIFTGGLVLVLYVILAFVIPLNPFQGGPMGAYPAGAPGTAWGQPGPAPAAGGPAYAAGAPTWSPDWSSQWETRRAARAERPGRGGLIIGTVLIVFGVIALADVAIPGWVSGALFGPALLLAIGAAVLVASLRRDEPAASPAAGASPAAATAPASTFNAAPPAAPASTFEAASVGYESDLTTTVPPQSESDPT